MKTCSICKTTKPFTKFHKAVRNKDGFRGECKSCQNEYNMNWRKTNPEKAASQRLKTRYGITFLEKQQMVEKQEGKCAICNAEVSDLKHSHVDHCHTTEKIRGILCQACNKMLGYAKDNIETLRNAIKYLSTY